MKALLMLAVIAGAVWLWRSRQAGLNRPAKPSAPPQPLDMVRCQQCGVHIASNESIEGKRGAYCCQEHLRESEH